MIRSSMAILALMGMAGALSAAPLFYFKQAQTLTPIPQRLAVLSNDPAAAGLAAGAKTVTPYAIAPWHILDQAQASPAGKSEFVTPVFNAARGGHQFPTEFVMVGFREDVDEGAARRMLREQFPAMSDLQVDFGNMHNVFRFRTGLRNGMDVMHGAAKLAVRDEVNFSEPDMICTGGSAVVPTDPLFSSTWGLLNTGQSGGLPGFDLKTTTAWDTTWGNPNILTLVLDTGTQQNHPDIRQVPGADFTGQGGGGGPVNSFDNHGTPVSGCISGIQNNGLGSVGAAPGTRVASARPFISTNSSGNWSTQWSWSVDALTWGESLGARVSNNSNYYGQAPAVVTNKYNQSYTSGMVHFASAGNFASTTIGYPANLPNVNAIIALNRAGGRASFSDSGVGSDFSAPGQDILTTDRQGASGWVSGDYVSASGTSFASPYSAGVAALVLSVNPYLVASQVEQVLRETARDLGNAGYDLGFGWGMPNANSAVAQALEIKMFGSILFSGRVAGFPSQVILDFDTVGTVADAVGVQVPVDSGQSYTTVAPLGSFTVRFYASGFLGKRYTVVNPGLLNLNVELVNGDVNRDNEIGPGDFSPLALAFGSFLGDSNYSAAADLNGDGEVGPGDFAILAAGFGRFGD